MKTDRHPVSVESGGQGISLVVMDRPNKHNAMDADMASHLMEAFSLLVADSHTEAIVLTGRGNKAFCAGADVGNIVARRDQGDFSDPAAEAAEFIRKVPKPVIAAINGFAFGGGAALALACDIRIASTNASFKFVGSQYGVVVCAAQLPRVVGPSAAKTLIFTGKTLPADEALSLHLVDMVVSSDELLSKCEDLCTQIVGQSSAAITASKKIIDLASLDEGASQAEWLTNEQLRRSPEHDTLLRSAFARLRAPQTAD